MDPKVTLNFSQLERDYNLFKLLENRVLNKSGKEYFAAKARLILDKVKKNLERNSPFKYELRVLFPASLGENK